MGLIACINANFIPLLQLHHLRSEKVCGVN